MTSVNIPNEFNAYAQNDVSRKQNRGSLWPALKFAPNIAEIFGPKALRSLYIRRSRKRLPIFKTSPYVKYAFVLENGQSRL